MAPYRAPSKSPGTRPPTVATLPMVMEVDEMPGPPAAEVPVPVGPLELLGTVVDPGCDPLPHAAPASASTRTEPATRPVRHRAEAVRPAGVPRSGGCGARVADRRNSPTSPRFPRARSPLTWDAAVHGTGTGTCSR